jgi:hypothetical protein
MAKYPPAVLAFVVLLLGLSACGDVIAATHQSTGSATPLATWTPATSGVVTARLTASPFTASAAPVLTLPAGADFGIVFAWGSCFTERLDTLAGTFSRSQEGSTPLVVSLRLSATDLVAIRDEARAIDLAAYPEQFAIRMPLGGSGTTMMPATRYNITVLEGGRVEHVQWTDDIVAPTTTMADRLRSFVGLILQIVEADPVVRQLPLPRRLCA